MKRSPRKSLSLFRSLLWLYPAVYRRRFGAEMEATFQAENEELASGGRLSRWNFYWRTLRQVLFCAALEHLEQRKRGRTSAQALSQKSGRHLSGGEAVRILLQDLKLAIRALRNQPGQTLIAVLALGLGIGFTATMFSILNGTFLRGLPFEQPHQLVALGTSAHSGGGFQIGMHDFIDWRDRQESLEDIGAFYTFYTHLSGESSGTETYIAAFTTANTFDLLRVKPILGRGFEPADEQPSTPLVAVLSYQTWRQQFGADPGVIGQEVMVNRQPATVIGVMPEGFGFPLRHRLWVSIKMDPSRGHRGQSWPRYFAFGRLKEGAALQQARVELETLAQQLELEYPESNQGVGAHIEPYINAVTDTKVRDSMGVMVWAVLGVFFVACANVANLLLVRNLKRQREIAVRTALGAGRWRVMSHALSEAWVLTVLGAILGLAVAHFGIQLFNLGRGDSFLTGFWIDVRLDRAALAFVFFLICCTTLLAGVMPALRAAGTRTSEVLTEMAGATMGLRLGRLSRSLVVVEVALSCALLVVAGLMIESLRQLHQVDHGFQPEGVFTASVSFLQGDYEPSVNHRLFEQLMESLEKAPQVEQLAFTSALPLGRSRWQEIAIRGQEKVDRTDPATPDGWFSARWISVSPDFFDVFGVGLLLGRPFSSTDRAGAEAVAVVNRGFVERHFPDGGALQAQIRVVDPRSSSEPGENKPLSWVTIVGIVPDISMGIFAPQESIAVYRPLAQMPQNILSLAVRPSGGLQPMELAPLVRSEVASLDRFATSYRFEPMLRHFKRQTWNQRFLSTLFSLFGSATLFLAALGLYGVMAFAAGQRVREVGLRMALGARGFDVQSLLLRSGLGQLILGLSVGLSLAVYLSHVLSSQLFGVEPWNLFIFAGVACLLLAVGLFACWLPAHWASRVDPIVALRHD